MAMGIFILTKFTYTFRIQSVDIRGVIYKFEVRTVNFASYPYNERSKLEVF